MNITTGLVRACKLCYNEVESDKDTKTTRQRIATDKEKARQDPATSSGYIHKTCIYKSNVRYIIRVS